jgi:hypothetical protein
MSTTTFVCKTPIAITADASIFTGDIIAAPVEYSISLNYPINTFFSESTYQDNVNGVNVSLNSTVNLSDESASLSATSGVNGNGILSGTTRDVGQRLVEVLAIKLFGNARARAALANETTIESTVVSVGSALQADKLDIFNEYAALDRTDNENNVDGPKPFNFLVGDSFEFRLLLSSTASGTDGAPSANYLTPGAAVGSYSVNGTPTQATSFNTSTGVLTDCPISLTVTLTEAV